jgi:hypothetical protein
MDERTSTTASYSIDGEQMKEVLISSKHTTTTQQPRRRILQNFLLIWLDANIDESNEDSHHALTQLQQIVSAINTFTTDDQCINFLTQVKDEKAFMIVSDAFSQRIIPFIHDMSQLDSIYVLYGNKSSHEQWAEE